MENLDNFFEVLPYNDSQSTEAFAPFVAVRQSWAPADSISHGSSNWIYGNFSGTLKSACESNSQSRIAKRAILFVKQAGEYEGRAVYMFLHS